MKHLTISIVIPAYNEEKLIRGCLESIASQTVKPDEVIVVDNNSSDRTVDIAESFPFVQVIRETKQGRGYARSAGFNAARSDIVGRIDADSILDIYWVERVVERFVNDISLVGITGLGKTSFLPGIQFVRSTIFSRIYYWYVHAEFHTITMWGSTMAVKRSEWMRVSDKVINDDKLVHEDQDLSLWIASDGGKIIQDNSLKISTSGQSFRYLPKIISYKRLFDSTKKIHTENGNLSSNKLRKLSYLHTLPGKIYTYPLGAIIIILTSLMFPIDYLIARKLRKQSWLK